MSADDFDEIFSGRSNSRPTFAERLSGAPQPPIETPSPKEGDGAYKAFGFMPSGVGECCDVQRWMDGTSVAEGIEFQYRFLMQIGYVGEEQLKLFLPDCIIVLEGRHLRELRKKLARRQVTFIQQFSPLVWQSPGSGVTILNTIQVVRP